MQKTIIAAAIIGLVSVGASAATVFDKDGLKVDLGGKFDMAVTYKDTGAKQTFTMQDGAYATSRFTISASQAINDDLSAYYGVDLRFGAYDGKNGVGTNDATKGGLLSKKLGRIEFGNINVAAQQFSKAKKPYVHLAESELVKYGISQSGISALSKNTVYVHTTTQLPVILKGSMSISDNRATDAAGSKKNMYSAGVELKQGAIDAGAAAVVKPSSTYGTSNRINHNEAFVSYTQKALKTSLHVSHDKDYATSKKGNGYSLNAYYIIGDKLEIGAEMSMYKDQSSGTKYDGKGYMLNAQYVAAKGVAFFVGAQAANWDQNANGSNAAAVGKIDGNAAGFLGTFSKADSKSYTAGVNFAF